jgi:hypothetical protein
VSVAAEEPLDGSGCVADLLARFELHCRPNLPRAWVRVLVQDEGQQNVPKGAAFDIKCQAVLYGLPER